jgi:hypothetical protein
VQSRRRHFRAWKNARSGSAARTPRDAEAALSDEMDRRIAGLFFRAHLHIGDPLAVDGPSEPAGRQWRDTETRRRMAVGCGNLLEYA